MTQRQFEERLRLTLERAILIMQTVAPKRTGKLRDSITLIATPQGYKIFLDMNKAPHAPYTNEPWIHPRWRGRKNPNEAWFQMAVDLVFQLLRRDLGGNGIYIGDKGV